MLPAVAAAVLIAALGLIGLFPGPAKARFTKREAKVSVRTAARYWEAMASRRFERPRYRCSAQTVRVLWVADLGPAMASAGIGGCAFWPPTIALERPTMSKLDDVGACGVITHEFGHLLGFRHTRHLKNVMSGHPGLGVRPPRRATWQRAWDRCERRL